MANNKLTDTGADIGYLRTWIGKQDAQTDTITPALVDRFTATFTGYTPLSETLASPLGIHWCLAPPVLPRSELGPDGHPATGGFLPPVPLARRMWASSEVEFLQAPRVNTPIIRTSTIADVALKHSSSSGPLVFVQVENTFTQSSTTDTTAQQELLVRDRQTLVFRQPSNYKRTSPQQTTATAESLRIVPDSTLLFRYSALTFNGHRIHYDHTYATEDEGYPGMVVHGPLMATLLLNLAQSKRPKQALKKFAFRGLAPAFVDQPLLLAIKDATPTQDTAAETLEIKNPEGAIIMSASAHFG